MTRRAGCAQTLIDGGREFLLEGAIAADDRVSSDEGTRFAGKYTSDALNHRPYGDDRADTDRKTNEEEEQPPPRRAHFTQRHPDDECHNAPLATAVVRSSTGRPSLSVRRASAIAATEGSCVTSTSVARRAWR